MSSTYFGNDGATQFQGGGYGGYALRAREDSLFVSLSLSLSFYYALSFFFFFFFFFFFSRWVSIFEKMMIQNRARE